MSKFDENKGRTTDLGYNRANFVKRLDSFFDIGAPDAIHEIKKSRFLSEKKNKTISIFIWTNNRKGEYVWMDMIKFLKLKLK